MKGLLLIPCLALLVHTSASAQTDKEEHRQERAEKSAANKVKVDLNVFRRQILTLKEYSEERRRLSTLPKTEKEGIKVIAYVDSTNEDENSTLLMGYIAHNSADGATNLFEITYDRAQKKITSIKATPEYEEMIKEAHDSPAAKAAPAAKAKPARKKDEDDEDEDDGGEEKPAKGKPKPKPQDPDDE